ncbi:hypothetical protein ACEV99_22280 [Vibrio parahaemolyticus]|uniref:hypothetical protein n=1 Tax=Vibrio parahaemolyticus TaxID=670 RepID=UPI000984CE25|nr:hypothetical protein [Vibrio parahaemolyticus]OOI04110.1 hypothetical protein BIW16_07920 [Vibrio sp. OULL4]TOH42434.1 hypothetical protein CGI81_23900 [Vibrio parahaemolyticus]
MNLDLDKKIEFSEDIQKQILEMVKHTALKENGETELFILKVHLLIEQLLEKVIKKSFPYPKSILESELTFSQKHAIVKAICYQDSISLVFKDIGILNKIRNELAHNLESKRYERLFGELDSSLLIESGYELKPNSLEKFKHRCYLLYGTLLGVCERLENS